MDKKTIQPVSEEVREAIRRKSASALPSNPSAAGMSPGDIKKAFYSPMIDPEDSLLGEIDRVAKEAGAAVQDLYERDQGTREKLYGDGGSEDEPKERSFAARIAENEKSIQKMGKEKVSFTDYATSSKAGVVKVSQGSYTNIGITDGLIKVLKATENHIAARGEDHTDFVLTASQTNDIVKAALTDKKKMLLLDSEKATARETIGAASTEDVNRMHLALSVDDDFKLTVSLLNTKNEVISVSNEIDLPLEEMIIGIDVNENEDGYILKLKTGETVPLSTEAIVRGLAKQEDFDELKEKFENQEVPKIELAPTLDGNETNKAPSVQAVKEGLTACGVRTDGLRLLLDYDSNLCKFKLHLVDADGNKQSSTEEIDLPLESTIIGIAVSEDGENLILTLNNGAQSTIPAEAIVRGLAKQGDLDDIIEEVEALKNKKIELAGTLSGNEPDKAPSVQAVNAELANALKCEKSGASVVLADISPITHALKVSVEDVEDLSSVKVLVPGKNLFDINSSDGFLTTSGGLSNEIIGNEIKVVCSAQARSGSLKLGTFNAGTYYISIASDRSGTFYAFVGDAVGSLTSAQIQLPGSITIKKPTTIWAYTTFSNTVESYIISNVQIELGNTATEYEPFDLKEYPVNADGTVDGIKSIYPSTVLMTNTAGATIKCEYNRDAAKYADKVDGKLDTVTSAGGSSRLYAVTSGGTQSLMSVGRSANPSWVVQREEKGHVLVPLTPTDQNNSTSKKYVDDTAAAIRAELGKQVFTVSQGKYSDIGWLVPNGALPNFYLETTLLEYSYEVDGVFAENFAKGNFTKLTFYDENDNFLGEKPATSQTFYEMPSGTAKIHHNGVYLDYNPPWDSCVMRLTDLKFQVKVGA